jgi:monoamine oxidase
MQSAQSTSPATNLPKVSGRPVVVIGAGLSGLVAALDLVKSGVDVVVLEAQSRPGGRIHTIRAPFTGGLYAEAGATHVIGDPQLLAVIASAGVKVIQPKAPRGLAGVTYIDGKRSRLGPDEEAPRRTVFSADEEALDFQGRMRRYFGNVTGFDEMGPWPPPALARHDGQSGTELLRELGASPGYIEEFGKEWAGDRIDAMSGAFLQLEMAGFFRAIARQGGGRIEGGSDRLPFALAAQLGARVTYGAEVKRIEQDERGARVAFVRDGRLERIEADRVVCAIPYSVLRHVEVAPGFSAMKQRAVQELPMVSVVRAFAQIDKRLWSERGEAGDVETDLPTGSVRDETKLQPGKAGVLGAYLSNGDARRFTALPPAERLRAFVEGADKAHPGAKEHFVAGTVKSWDEDPFQRGAYAWFEKGQMTAFGGAIASFEGRVHFAGDHTSNRPGWMHGAVASAKRVVREVLVARG